MRTLYFVTAIVLGLTGAAAAQDVAGSEDHPMISRYPGSSIAWYLVDNNRPYRIPVGPVTGYRSIDEWVETQGRITRIYYVLDGGARTETEVFQNYQDAVKSAGFEVLAEGIHQASARSVEVGSQQWQQVLYIENSFPTGEPVNEMVRGSSTSGGRGSIVAKKERAEGTAYLVVSVYQFREDRVSILVDVIEVAAAETGLITIDAEAIGRGIAEEGRVVLDGIFFDFDKATLQPASKDALEQIAIFLKGAPDLKFYVVGHTDSKGTLAYNRDLSAARAKAVADALSADHGIAKDRLEPHGVGPLSPVFANASDAGRERNRRVELVER